MVLWVVSKTKVVVVGCAEEKHSQKLKESCLMMMHIVESRGGGASGPACQPASLAKPPSVKWVSFKGCISILTRYN
jgi:hypothetical protein